MMLIVLLLICYFSVTKYKKTTLFCAAVLLLQPHLASGIGNVKLLYLVCLLQIVLFFVKGYWKQRNHKYYPAIALISILSALAYLYSTYRGVMFHTLPVAAMNSLFYFAYPYVVWRLIRTREDLVFILKSLLVFALVVGAYALVEASANRNFYSEFANNYGLVAGLLGGEDLGERFGLPRCNSVLPYSSALAMFSGTIWFIVAYMKVNEISFNKRIELFLLFVMPFCVLLGGTRSQMVFTAICMFPFLLYSRFWRSNVSRVAVVIIFVVMLFFSDYIFWIIDSIIHSDQARMGSSTELRQKQFDICYKYFVKNPIWGYGRNYIWEYVRAENPGLMGAESVWFQIMVDYGSVGCALYVALVGACVKWVSRYSLVFISFPLAFIVGKTLSIVIGVELSFLLIICIILVKMHIFFIPQKVVQKKKHGIRWYNNNA